MLSERERSYISNKKNHHHHQHQSSDSSHSSQKQRTRDRDRGRDGDRDRRQQNQRERANSSEERFQEVSDPRHKEVVVFEFGAVVLWGFSVGEESVLLQTIKDFAADGQSLVTSEFTASEDDMAFITHSQRQRQRSQQLVAGRQVGGSSSSSSSSSDSGSDSGSGGARRRGGETPRTTRDDGEEGNNSHDDDYDSHRKSHSSNSEENVDLNSISIANDVISFPEKTCREHRLAVSYAIAQSSIVAIFEERIMQKVAEYKFIPETLASVGKIELSAKEMGMMVGEIFVIRHDLNLHSDILDTPDFFWGEQDR